MPSTGWQRADGTTRRALPPYWKSLRRRVFERDGYLCQVRGPNCTGGADECDHIDTTDPGNHSMSNLRSICATDHAERTKQQAADGARAYHARRLRPQGKHPGYK